MSSEESFECSFSSEDLVDTTQTHEPAEPELEVEIEAEKAGQKKCSLYFSEEEEPFSFSSVDQELRPLDLPTKSLIDSKVNRPTLQIVSRYLDEDCKKLLASAKDPWECVSFQSSSHTKACSSIN